MWRSTVDGRTLTFHLAGINNENFIMRDDETGSWWQQASGEAIQGPLRGARLEPVLADEVSFSIWRGEHPRGRVLVPDGSAPWREFSEDWEAQTAKLPVVSPASGPEPLGQRDVVVGVRAGGRAKAYPLAVLRENPLVLDTVGGVPVAVVLAEDGVSARVFDRRLDGGGVVELFRASDGTARLLDASGSEWTFGGLAVSGPLAGTQLHQLPALKDYWFDWAVYGGRDVYAPRGR